MVNGLHQYRKSLLSMKQVMWKILFTLAGFAHLWNILFSLLFAALKAKERQRLKILYRVNEKDDTTQVPAR